MEIDRIMKPKLQELSFVAWRNGCTRIHVLRRLQIVEVFLLRACVRKMLGEEQKFSVYATGHRGYLRGGFSKSNSDQDHHPG